MPRSRSAGPRTSRLRVRLRAALLADLGTLVAHRLSMWRDIGSRSERSIRAHGPTYRTWARPRLVSGELEGVLAEVDGRVVASGALWWMPDQPRPALVDRSTPYIMSLYTDPAHRGEGVATAVVTALVRSARRRGASRVTLHASSQGRGVYERLGFEPTNEMDKWLRVPAGVRKRRRPLTSRGRAGSPR